MLNHFAAVEIFKQRREPKTQQEEKKKDDTTWVGSPGFYTVIILSAAVVIGGTVVAWCFRVDRIWVTYVRPHHSAIYSTFHTSSKKAVYIVTLLPKRKKK